jgi:hypothetical protein
MGPQAGIHWLLPTAVVIYISKSYFDGYLKEAGKEQYYVLKNAIGSLWSTFFSENRVVRTRLVASRGKMPADQKYSITVSVMAEADAGIRFKLLFEDESSAEKLNLAIAGFLTFLEAYYEGRLDAATGRHWIPQGADARSEAASRSVPEGFGRSFRMRVPARRAQGRLLPLPAGLSWAALPGQRRPGPPRSTCYARFWKIGTS